MRKSLLSVCLCCCLLADSTLAQSPADDMATVRLAAKQLFDLAGNRFATKALTILFPSEAGSIDYERLAEIVYDRAMKANEKQTLLKNTGDINGIAQTLQDIETRWRKGHKTEGFEEEVNSALQDINKALNQLAHPSIATQALGKYVAAAQVKLNLLGFQIRTTPRNPVPYRAQMLDNIRYMRMHVEERSEAIVALKVSDRQKRIGRCRSQMTDSHIYEFYDKHNDYKYRQGHRSEIRPYGAYKSCLIVRYLYIERESHRAEINARRQVKFATDMVALWDQLKSRLIDHDMAVVESAGKRLLDLVNAGLADDAPTGLFPAEAGRIDYLRIAAIQFGQPIRTDSRRIISEQSERIKANAKRLSGLESRRAAVGWPNSGRRLEYFPDEARAIAMDIDEALRVLRQDQIAAEALGAYIAAVQAKLNLTGFLIATNHYPQQRRTQLVQELSTAKMHVGNTAGMILANKVKARKQLIRECRPVDVGEGLHIWRFRDEFDDSEHSESPTIDELWATETPVGELPSIDETEPEKACSAHRNHYALIVAGKTEKQGWLQLEFATDMLSLWGELEAELSEQE